MDSLKDKPSQTTARYGERRHIRLGERQSIRWLCAPSPRRVNVRNAETDDITYMFANVPQAPPPAKVKLKEMATAERTKKEATVISHFSVKEYYLMSNHLKESRRELSCYYIQLETAHTILAQACLGILLRLDNRIDRDTIQSFPLARDAAQYWVEHAQFGDVASRIEDGMDCLFDADKLHYSIWLGIFDEDGRSSPGPGHATF